MFRNVHSSGQNIGAGSSQIKARNPCMSDKYDSPRCPNCSDEDNIESHEHIFSLCPALQLERSLLMGKVRPLLETTVGQQWGQWWMVSNTPPRWQPNWQTNLGDRAAIPIELRKELDKHRNENRQGKQLLPGKEIVQQIAKVVTEGAREIWRTRCRIWHEKRMEPLDKNNHENNADT